MASNSSNDGNSNPRGKDRNKQLLKEYQDIVLAAQTKMAEQVDQLLADAAQILDIAGTNYTRATEKGRQAFNRIHEPARNQYEKQFNQALAVQAAIMDPAQQELERITASVKEMVNRAIQPIERIYSDMLNEASGITDQISLGGGLSG